MKRYIEPKITIIELNDTILAGSNEHPGVTGTPVGEGFAPGHARERGGMMDFLDEDE